MHALSLVIGAVGGGQLIAGTLLRNKAARAHCSSAEAGLNASMGSATQCCSWPAADGKRCAAAGAAMAYSYLHELARTPQKVRARRLTVAPAVEVEGAEAEQWALEPAPRVEPC